MLRMEKHQHRKFLMTLTLVLHLHHHHRHLHVVHHQLRIPINRRNQFKIRLHQNLQRRLIQQYSILSPMQPVVVYHFLTFFHLYFHKLQHPRILLILQRIRLELIRSLVYPLRYSILLLHFTHFYHLIGLHHHRNSWMDLLIYHLRNQMVT